MDVVPPLGADKDINLIGQTPQAHLVVAPWGRPGRPRCQFSTWPITLLIRSLDAKPGYYQHYRYHEQLCTTRQKAPLSGIAVSFLLGGQLSFLVAVVAFVLCFVPGVLCLATLNKNAGRATYLAAAICLEIFVALSLWTGSYGTGIILLILSLPLYPQFETGSLAIFRPMGIVEPVLPIQAPVGIAQPIMVHPPPGTYYPPGAHHPVMHPSSVAHHPVVHPSSGECHPTTSI
ncbi:hypothetical protein PSACC_00634 [Paramicrosporidium saccamoebae]|uniref:Uncharacterized protein n=1 Tax=Paramicrosporidium saccamoebae TaxID=1246581 RepID=A0A2H9TP67_9FUNG|nr:hypothetical protein PSACC_00634 [Paramicrosporidium saccamoebae]